LYTGIAIGELSSRQKLSFISMNGLTCSFRIKGYFLLVFLYGAIVYSSDWHMYAELAMERAEVKSKPGKQVMS
jgi:hypothetical protein